MAKTQSHKLPLVEWKASIPEALKKLDRWCGWRGKKPDGKADKSPRDLRTGERASSRDPATWGTFEEACAWYAKYEREPNAGCGVVTGDGIGATDYDGARADEAPLPWAEPRVTDLAAKTYVEVSPSGEGYRALVTGVDGMVEFKEGVEPSYKPHQFVTVTGARLGAAQAEVAPAPADLAPLFAANEPLPLASVTRLPASPAQLADDFARLYDALPVLGRHYQRNGLGYDEWTQRIAAPLQGSFYGTDLWPAVRRLFADLTRKLPGYRPGDEHKLDDFRRTDGEVRTVASIFGDADALDPAWRRERERREESDAETLPDGLDSGAALFDGALPPLDFAIEPYLPRGELVEVHGGHGQFKSTLLLYAALAVATGTPWNGPAPVRAGRTVFISLEDVAATLARRTRAWTRGLFLDERVCAARERAVRENFGYLGREKAAALAVTRLKYGETQARREVVEWLVEKCRGAALVVLETTLRLAPGPEDNDNLAVLAFALEEMATRTGAAVALIRHTSKEVSRSGKVDSYGGRGGGSLADAARGVLSVVREGDGADAPVRIVHTKSTHTAPGADLLWTPQPAEGGVFLQPVVGLEVGREDERKALAVLAEAGEEGRTWRELRETPRGGKGVSERREALRVALDRLVQAGKVTKEKDGKADRYRVVPGA